MHFSPNFFHSAKPISSRTSSLGFSNSQMRPSLRHGNVYRIISLHAPIMAWRSGSSSKACIMGLFTHHIDAAAGGSFFTLSIEKARKLVEKMASNQSWDEQRTQTRSRTTKIDLLMKKLENPGLDHLKMVDSRVTCEECGQMGHMGINCPMALQDVNFVDNSNGGFHPHQGFNARWNKSSFLFDNCQQGGMGQNFNRSELSLKDIVQDQLQINLEVGRKLLATDKILDSIKSKMNNFTVAVQNQLNLNKVLETRISQLAVALPHPNGGDFRGQPTVPIKEYVKAVITRSRKTVAEPKVKSKKRD
jgi:hypothetical protein